MVITRRTVGAIGTPIMSLRMREPAWVPTTAEPTPEASSPIANTRAGALPTRSLMVANAASMVSPASPRRAAAASSSMPMFTDPASSSAKSTSAF